MLKRNLIFAVLFTGILNCLYAQPLKQFVTVVVTPNHPDWVYQVGEKAEFSVSVLKSMVPLDKIEIEYSVQPEQLPAIKEGKLMLKNGTALIQPDKFSKPGFLRCNVSVEVDGKKYSSYATAGFSPEKIEPTTSLPADFQQFWENGKNELAKIPVNPVLTLMPERCTDKVDVYHVGINNIKGKIYGILCVPKAAGKYPAILHVPGAGVRPYYGDIAGAEKGFVTFMIGIHGIPVNLPQSVYDDLRTGALDGYWNYNFDDRDNSYYRRIYLGCVRAVDFISTLEKFDGQHIAVTGGSQGGALSIITAGLDNRIDYLAAFYPALSDLTGYLNNRAGGWPHLFRNKFTNKPDKVETSTYYDVVNFARFVKAKGWYSWGFNDNVCPPTSMYAAYNIITAPKELYIYQETQHWTFPEQNDKKDAWLYENLMK